MQRLAGTTTPRAPAQHAGRRQPGSVRGSRSLPSACAPFKQIPARAVRALAASPVEAPTETLNGQPGSRPSGFLRSSAQPQPQQHSGKFDWAQAWYPLAIEADLPTDRPTARRLLGNAVVLWKDGEGAWRAFRDLCPHRLAPLSEGRVENGELMCSYHGWQFRGSDGRATVIPQAVDAKANAAACASRRSCCQAYPCTVRDGLVWVFGSCEPGAAQAAEATPVLSSPVFAAGEHVQFTPWFMRELPYGAEILCENVLDPSHVPFSHHGVQGDRHKVPKMVMSGGGEVHPTEGFSVRNEDSGPVAEGKQRLSLTLSYGPPHFIRYQFSRGSEMITHAVPTDPGRSLVFFTFLLPRSLAPAPLRALFRLIGSRALLWRDHLTRNDVLDGDNVFLPQQEQELHIRQQQQQQQQQQEGKQQQGPEESDWSRVYYMPSSQDAAVRAFRRWQAQCALPIPWAPTARPFPLQQSRAQMLDRFSQHTQHCPSCRGAHRTFGWLQQAGTYAALIAAAYAAFALGNQQPAKRLLAPALAGLAAAGVAVLSRRLRSQMEWQDYRHPDH